MRFLNRKPALILALCLMPSVTLLSGCGTTPSKSSVKLVAVKDQIAVPANLREPCAFAEGLPDKPLPANASFDEIAVYAQALSRFSPAQEIATGACKIKNKGLLKLIDDHNKANR